MKEIKKKHQFWYGVWEVSHFDKDGNVIWSEEVRNGLADEGENNILDQYLRAQNAPTSFYLGLCNDTPTDDDTLTTITGEPSGFGYSRQQVTRDVTGWPTLALDAGDWMATSKLVTYTASGGTIGPVNCLFLTNVASGTAGKFLAFAALSQSRTLQDSESLGCKMKIKLQ